jgi:hypothetical protein
MTLVGYAELSWNADELHGPLVACVGPESVSHRARAHALPARVASTAGPAQTCARASLCGSTAERIDSRADRQQRGATAERSDRRGDRQQRGSTAERSDSREDRPQRGSTAEMIDRRDDRPQRCARACVTRTCRIDHRAYTEPVMAGIMTRYGDT